MKQLLLLVFILPLFSFKLAAQIDKTQFIGRWIASEETKIAFINFDQEGFVSIEGSGQVMGGKEFDINGQKGQMTYNINTETSPINIDLVITKLETGESLKLLGIVEFIDTNTMIMDVNFDGNRPIHFNPNQAITFNRSN